MTPSTNQSPSNYWTQHPGEKRTYQQQYTSDTIVGPAIWTLEPVLDTTPVPTLSNQGDTATSSQIMVSGIEAGQTYLGKVIANGTSGQIFENDFKIVGN